MIWRYNSKKILENINDLSEGKNIHVIEFNIDLNVWFVVADFMMVANSCYTPKIYVFDDPTNLNEIQQVVFKIEIVLAILE
jgi:hypothetical protein